MIVFSKNKLEGDAAAGSSRISVADLFTIGIGPSSSHTVGPMRAAKCFVEEFARVAPLDVTRLKVELFGSLSLTGKGHRTDVAIIIGLLGWTPESIDPDRVDEFVDQLRRSGILATLSTRPTPFRPDTDIIFSRDFHPTHPNAVTFTALAGDRCLLSRTYFSVGGGFIVPEIESKEKSSDTVGGLEQYPFASAKDLLSIGRLTGLSIAQIVLANESSLRTSSDTYSFLDEVRSAMMACIERGYLQDGCLPGGLKVRRRAKQFRERLMQTGPETDPLHPLDWVSLYALSVNEENAAGGRVVTAPTNGAAGVIPAVLKYYETFCKEASVDGSRTFLLTAAAIGILYKRNASISAAEMGCQGEVGVACSMAAAGLTAALGGTNEQIENAAEIGMEHNLGLTCDPIGGLVQVPCIERNTMGALKAINASRLALFGDGSHVVSLDAVIETMRQTGNDMRSKYKETSLGGLAVNAVEC
jgi:L-serine dehydratase